MLRLAICAAVIVLLAPIAMAASGFAYLAAEGSGVPPATVPAATTGDGLWLGHAWVDGGHTDADLAALAARLEKTDIRDLFVHDGPFSGDGSLSPALSPCARWLVNGLHAFLPDVRVQAWLGDLVVPGDLDLDDPATRSRMLRSVQRVLADGFDGVQFDMEPVPSGDPGYLDLLRAAHVLTQSQHKILSVAADQVEPLPGLRVPAQWATGHPHFWSAGYLGALARDVDEVAMMTYDTGMPTAATYAGFVRLKTGIALRAMPRGVHLLIGLPAYHTGEAGHTSAETVANAIRGVRLALGSATQPKNVGVALYVGYSATPADWSAYRADWVFGSHVRQDVVPASAWPAVFCVMSTEGSRRVGGDDRCVLHAR